MQDEQLHLPSQAAQFLINNNYNKDFKYHITPPLVSSKATTENLDNKHLPHQ